MKTLRASKDHLVSLKGAKIFYRHYPAVEERARLVIAHGLGEHSGRYENVVHHLNPAGISIWAIDHVGHGRSEGQRGHITRFDQYVLDLKLLVDKAQAGLPQSQKVFLLGHSLGGLIALTYALQFSKTISAVIASSPALGMTVAVPPVKVLMGKIMSAVWPKFSMGNELDATKISRDDAVVQAYIDDPLVHDRVSARWFTEFVDAMKKTREAAQKLSIPILMQLAGDDYLVDPDASQGFFKDLTVRDKTLHLYEGLFHEIYNAPEKNKDKVLSDLLTWMDQHISATDA